MVCDACSVCHMCSFDEKPEPEAQDDADGSSESVLRAIGADYDTEVAEEEFDVGGNA